MSTIATHTTYAKNTLHCPPSTNTGATSKKMKIKIPKIKKIPSELVNYPKRICNNSNPNPAMLEQIIVYYIISPRILYNALAVHFWCLYKAPLQKDIIHLE